ncbi:MAG TPA: IS21 family transposase [Anaerolineae bacterium]|nr:IS21 family transposase [Anaerolineae bacterium]
MERSTIHYLKQKGWSNLAIAEAVGCHRDTVGRILREPVDYAGEPRQRVSQIAVYDTAIKGWLEENVSVRRMLEMVHSDPEHPYFGSDSAFYNYVQPLRQVRTLRVADVAVRFEGLPGELLQIDWGEVRQFPFTKPELVGQTRYFFAARLKYSRWMFVRFTREMREETLLRCLVACLVALGGVPWAVTSDNMKTITLGRDAQNQPIWHPAYQKFAAEFGFHPSLCAPGAGNQKGSVENLVKYVKGNFLLGRRFHDDLDLEQEQEAWLHRVNHVRTSQATEQTPAALLAEECRHFAPLPAAAQDYGFFDSVLVNRESLVHIAANRYSVPAHLVGHTLTARIHAQRIDLFDGRECVATHRRHFGRNARIIVPEHYEAVFVRKPRARVMVYRDWLVGLSPTVADYMAQVCHKHYDQMESQVLGFYALAQEAGVTEFMAAVELAAEQAAVGVDYVRALLHAPQPVRPAPTPVANPLTVWLAAPPQATVERALSHYERYVANPVVDAVAPGVAMAGGGA